MKKIFLMLTLVLAAALTSCKQDELVFDHEYPQFELNPNAILLEVLMPNGTAAEDELYIVGDFNGGEDVAVGDLKWRLEPSENIHKWGIYLYPEDFVGGKTLADGYYFYSKKDGRERSPKNEDVLHYETAAKGQRINNIMVSRWEASFFVDDDDVKHDGYAIFIQNGTGWDAIALYAWGDAEIFGGWPGILPTGTQRINGIEYTYFDTGAANTGLSVHLIFNNNNNGIQYEGFEGSDVVLDRDYYYTLDTENAYPAEKVVKHDGFAIFIDNQTGWDEIALYGWGSDLPELFGGWPGALPTGTQTVNGVEYTYFDTGAANAGLNYNLIFNNNGGGTQLADVNATLDKDYYFRVTTSGAVEIDPANPGAGGDDPGTGGEDPGEEDPGTDEPVEVTHTIYVNNTTGWETLHLYAWGDAEIFGGWPGAAPSGSEEVNGVTYTTFTVTAAEGSVYNLIFNNSQGGEGNQFNGPVYTLDHDLYLNITADLAWSYVTEEVAHDGYAIFIDNQLSWAAIALYAWGSDLPQLFGDWPGILPTGTQIVDGVLYTYFDTGAANEGLNYNLIFNNNNGGSQLEGFEGSNVTLDKDYFFRATDRAIYPVAAEAEEE